MTLNVAVVGEFGVIDRPSCLADDCVSTVSIDRVVDRRGRDWCAFVVGQVDNLAPEQLSASVIELATMQAQRK